MKAFAYHHRKLHCSSRSAAVEMEFDLATFIVVVGGVVSKPGSGNFAKLSPVKWWLILHLAESGLPNNMACTVNTLWSQTRNVSCSRSWPPCYDRKASWERNLVGFGWFRDPLVCQEDGKLEEINRRKVCHWQNYSFTSILSQQEAGFDHRAALGRKAAVQIRQTNTKRIILTSNSTLKPCMKLEWTFCWYTVHQYVRVRWLLNQVIARATAAQFIAIP